MMEKRNIGLCILLSIVTCGFYLLYWYYVVLKELYTLNGQESKAGTDLLLSLVTCGIYFVYIIYKMGDMADNIRRNNGAPTKNQGVLYIVLSIFGLSVIVFAILQNDLNEELYAYGNKPYIGN